MNFIYVIAGFSCHQKIWMLHFAVEIFLRTSVGSSRYANSTQSSSYVFLWNFKLFRLQVGNRICTIAFVMKRRELKLRRWVYVLGVQCQACSPVTVLFHHWAIDRETVLVRRDDPIVHLWTTSFVNGWNRIASWRKCRMNARVNYPQVLQRTHLQTE